MGPANARGVRMELLVLIPVHVQNTIVHSPSIGARGCGAYRSLDMEKLQEIVDAVFGAVNNQPPPPSPNEFTVQRQRAFDESARKIEALRRARLERRS